MPSRDGPRYPGQSCSSATSGSAFVVASDGTGAGFGSCSRYWRTFWSGLGDQRYDSLVGVMSPSKRSMRKIAKNAATQANPTPTEPNRTFADQPEKNVHQTSRENSAAGQTNRTDILKLVGSSHVLAHITPWARHAMPSRQTPIIHRPRVEPWELAADERSAFPAGGGADIRCLSINGQAGFQNGGRVREVFATHRSEFDANVAIIAPRDEPYTGGRPIPHGSSRGAMMVTSMTVPKLDSFAATFVNEGLQRGRRLRPSRRLGSGVRFFEIGGRSASFAIPVRFPPIPKNRTPDP